MTTPDLPENWQELVAAYALGDLEPQEESLVNQWLETYPAVHDELVILTQTLAELPFSLPLETPPAALRDRLMATVNAAPVSTADAETAVPTFTPVARPPLWRRLSFWLGTGWALTAIALAAIAQENYRLRQAQRETEAIVASFTQPTNRLYTLQGTENQPQASGRLVIDPNQGEALITTRDLPPLPADQAYRLWALADSTPVFCGQFNPSPDAPAQQWSLPDSACDSDSVQMLITAESASAPPTPAGPLVLQSQS